MIRISDINRTSPKTKLVVFLVYSYKVLGWEAPKCLRAQVFEKKSKNSINKDGRPVPNLRCFHG